MRALEIEARAHDDLQPRPAADGGELFGVAADADIGGVDHGMAAQHLVARQFRQCRLGIIEREIVAVHVGVHPQLADDLHAHRHFAEMALVGVAGALPGFAAIEQDMLVHQRDAHLVHRHRPQHRHDLSGRHPDFHPIGHCQSASSSALRSLSCTRSSRTIFARPRLSTTAPRRRFGPLRGWRGGVSCAIE